MTYQAPVYEFGFLIERDNRYGTEYVSARLIARDKAKDYPCNVSADLGRDLCFEGFQLQGFYSEFASEGMRFIAFEPRFYDVHSISPSMARGMSKTFALVERRFAKDAPTTPGEIFLSVCRALKLTFAVCRQGPSRGSSYSDSDWAFMSVQEGKRRLEYEIRQGESDFEARKAG